MGVQLSLVPPDSYSIDTNIFLDIWCPPEGNIFSKTRMPELWEHIEKLVEDHKIIATREVYDELKDNASDDLLEWLEAHKYMFIAHDEKIISYASSIINNVYAKYKNGFRPAEKDAADPFVVALGLARNATVFTQESRQAPHEPRNLNGPKVPTVCEAYGHECVNMEEFILKEGFNIRMVKVPVLPDLSTKPAILADAV